MSQVLVDDEIAKDIYSLNSKKKKKKFRVFHTWAEDFVKYDGRNVNQCTYLLYQQHCFITVRNLKNQESSFTRTHRGISRK